ncbi:MAG TPA: glycosyltransferase [Vicinamibacterales bacterium]|nr:glycosyltransferase [Vicinamibacterales bacterium]
MPEVSIIIPAFNAGRTIDTALRSVFAQTVANFELIVVDNGSTDDTAARVAAFGPGVTCCTLTHGSAARAWNTGLGMARGRFVALLEPADAWMPRKLDRQLRFLATYPQTGLLHGHAVPSETPDATILGLADELRPDAPATAPAPVHGPDPKAAIDTVAASTVMVPRHVLEVVGEFDETLPPAPAAQDLWARIALRYPVGRIEYPLAIVRVEAAPGASGRAVAAGRRNLLHDTCFRRARSGVTSVVHRVDDAFSRRRHPQQRILFEAASPMSLAVFAPVLRELSTDPRLEFWFTCCGRSWTPRAIFGSAGITERVVPSEQVRWSKFDLYINTDFWDMTWLPRRTRRMHFFHGVAGKYGLDAPVRIAPVVATFDRLMFPNRDRLQRYADAGLIDGDSAQAALVGYPKVDCLVDGSLDRAATLARVGVIDRRPTVLYAPTWSPYSSLNTVGRDVIEALGRLGVHVIVKLHDRSYDAAARGSGGIDWRRQLRELCDRSGARLVQDADASPWLHAADLLITDHSSVGFEFMLLDRPIVVLDSPGLLAHARVNPEKASMLRSAAAVVHHPADLGSTVEHALAHPDEHSARRRQVAGELFYGPGTATSRAVRSVYDLLELPRPASVGLHAIERPIATQLASAGGEA